MSNPLPPKTSMLWNDHPYTLEEADQYLAMKVTYDVEDDAPAKREYWFQNGIKQSATYSVISDNSKQSTIQKSLTPVVGTLGFQE
ncbi:hypothetical protein BCU30_015170 [Vibrio lentus]|uniref:hypothetical protein n=1 Tax=Vibrio lentus TaxID=136468 RepID=UPI000A4B7D43